MAITTFIPTIWSARLLQHLDDAHVAKNFFNTDYEGEISDMGDTVRINQIGAISIFNYQRNTDMNPPEDVNTVAQDLIIDKGDAFNFQIDDIDRVQARSELMDKAMERSAYALADKMDKYLFKQLADGADTSNKIASLVIDDPDKAFSLLVQLRTILTKANVPSQGRRLAVPPEFIGYLLEDTKRFVAASGTNAEGRLLSGMVGRALGFDIFEVNNLPETAGEFDIVCNHQISATYANQIVKTEAYRMEKRFADGLKGLSVYGSKIIIPKAVATAKVSFA